MNPQPTYLHEKKATDFDAIRLAIASPERILDWSHGKVTKPETINYRTQKPEKDGLFCERIFGPTKDWECYCGKYKGAHYRGVVCDRCGVLVARSIVRRERMGHIELAVPVTHVWFLRGTPSSIGLILNMTGKSLEKIVYFASYVVTQIDDVKKKEALDKLEAEFKVKQEEVKTRFDKHAAEKETDIKALAENQDKEIAQIEAEYLALRGLVDGLNAQTLLTENEYRELSVNYGSLFKAKIGADAVVELLRSIDLDKVVKELGKEAADTQGQRKRKVLKRLKMLEGMQKAGVRPEWMIMTHLPVIPPDLRPMVQLTGGRFATSDLNDLYRRVINRNNRLQKLMDMNAPEVICRNEMRMLQEAVDALIDNSHSRGGRAVSATGGRRKLKSLSDMLRGKQGRFRQNLLGKRVDYSGRSVIVAGPELKIDQCGLPKIMALELFKPFVIGTLIEREQAHNVKVAGRMIERGEIEVWDALDEVIKNKYVLLNRAPTLHRLGVQAFQPMLVEGKAIQLNPLVCAGFNADFDGDQMAVHLPLSDAAQAEAGRLMAANHNLLKPSDGGIIISVTHEMVLGIYYITYEKYEEPATRHSFRSISEAQFALENGQIELQTPILIDYKEAVRKTTLGRALFNELLPEDYEYIDQTMADGDLKQLLDEVFNRYGEELTAELADSIKAFGFVYASKSGLSTGMDDYIIPPQKSQILEQGEKQAQHISEQYKQGLITNQERYRLTVEAWRQANDQLTEALTNEFEQEDNSTTITVNSGARAKLSTVAQIAGMKGLVQDVYGNTIELPIKSNYKEGFSPLEYFSSARGSRKGLVDTALRTADSGYLTRRMVDVAQDVFTVEEDCAATVGVAVERERAELIGASFAYSLTGRVAATSVVLSDKKVAVKKGQLITKEVAEIIVGDPSIASVNIRSVLSCHSQRGCCRLCYGTDLGRGGLVDLRVPVGVIAAQAVGEPATQLTLRTFHRGGVAEEDITHGFSRIEELFEARQPKGQAVLAEMNGVASVREEKENYVLRIQSPKTQIEEFPVAKDDKPIVENGQEVEIGEILAISKTGVPIAVSKLAGKVKLSKTKLSVSAIEATVAEYTVPGYRTVLVKDGDIVTRGQALTSGSMSLQDLLRLTDEATVQRYIMTEIQSIFSMQGQTIADKHLEVVVRQMFTRVQVEEPGDSLFVTGDIISRAMVIAENERLTGEKKQPVTYSQLLLGIIKVSMWSDSFLSAASFQDTTRVLINAAINGRVDNLYGLKENVIIGRQIPVGTGYHGIDVDDKDA